MRQIDISKLRHAISTVDDAYCEAGSRLHKPLRQNAAAPSPYRAENGPKRELVSSFLSNVRDAVAHFKAR